MRFFSVLGLAVLGLAGCESSYGDKSSDLFAPERSTTESPTDPAPADDTSPPTGTVPAPQPSSIPDPGPGTPPAKTGTCTSLSASPNVVSQEVTSEYDASWLDVIDARTPDSQAASVNLDSYTSYSANLYARDFKLAIPTSAQIKGVALEIKRKTAGTKVGDLVVYLATLGAPGSGPKHSAVLTQYGDDRSKQGYWPTGSYTTATYGSETDLWGAGTKLDAATMNASSFGVHFAVANDGSDATAYVDSIKLTVHYCE